MESLRRRRTMIEFAFRFNPLKIRSLIAHLSSRVRRIGHGDSAPNNGPIVALARAATGLILR
ncbi:hypothetical protein [Micromonospora sp. NPDC006431]|uniref:hypothetical protein n=1 Tax=Micromonospora sp. NPDC006431 TaxID=3364235 RepID=UPI003678DCCA